VSNRSEKDVQRRDLEEWYKVKAVEMSTKDQKRQQELQDALTASEADKKELKLRLNEAK
jgi:hypothetical protein